MSSLRAPGLFLIGFWGLNSAAVGEEDIDLLVALKGLGWLGDALGSGDCGEAGNDALALTGFPGEVCSGGLAGPSGWFFGGSINPEQGLSGEIEGSAPGVLSEAFSSSCWVDISSSPSTLCWYVDGSGTSGNDGLVISPWVV